MHKLPIFFFVLCFSSFIPFLEAAGLRCTQVMNNDAFFSLEDLTSPTDYKYSFTSESRSFNIYYNFCRLASRTCNSTSSYAVLFPLDANQQELNDSCIHLTSDSLLKNYDYSLINSDDPAVGIQLQLTEGDNFNESLQYQFTFQINCDKGSLADKFVLDKLTQDENEFLAVGRSNDGCPLVQFSEVYQFILDYKYIFGIFSIIIGVVECFFGLRVFKPSLFIIGYISGFGFLILIFGEFVMTPSTSVLLIWILLLISVFFGAVTGQLATSLPKIGFMGLGLWLGFVLAFVINNLFLYKIQVSPPGLLLYFVMAILGILFAIASMYMWRQICILGTSFLGAYLVIRSLSLYIGGYPDELTLDLQIQYKELESVGWQFYVYFLFLALLTILGAFVQFRNKNKIGGKFAGEFENLDKKEVGDQYVEMENVEVDDITQNPNLQKPNSVIREVTEEWEDMISRKTPKNLSKVQENSQYFLNDENSDLKEKFRNKSMKIPKNQELEIIHPKKSFQGDVHKKSGNITPPKKNLEGNKKIDDYTNLRQKDNQDYQEIELREQKIIIENNDDNEKEHEEEKERQNDQNKGN